MALLVRLFFVAIVLGFVAPSTAYADTAREKAGKHVIDGDQLKVEAEEAKGKGDTADAQKLFKAAAEEYQAAYDLVPHPLMLYNLAQVSRLAGDQQSALDFYLAFLKTKPSGEAAQFARSYVRILERSLARDRDRKGDDDDDDDIIDDDDDDDDDFDDDDDDDPIEEPGPAAAKADDSGKGMRYGGMGLAAAGLVSIAVGVKFGLDAQSISSCLTNYPQSCDSDFPADQWTDEALLLEDEGASASQKMLIFTGLGAAAIVAGGVMYYMADGSNKEPDSAIGFSPTVSTESVGMGFSGRF